MKQVYTVLVNVVDERDIKNMINVVTDEGLYGRKVSRALICDNIMYVELED